MSASQLLRILQTLPAGANDELCGFNADELVASMNRSSSTNPFLSNEDDNKLDFWNNPELETSIFSGEYTNTRDDETFRKSCKVPSHLFEKTTGFYIDKHSLNCELPELIVCYKERDFNVKDCCIDEALPDEETITIGKDNNNNNNNHEYLRNNVPVNGDDDDDMIEANLHTEFLKHEWLRPSNSYMHVEIKSSTRHSTNNYGPDSSSSTASEDELNSSTNLQDDVSTEQLASNSMFSLQQEDWSLQFPESSNNYVDDVNQLSLEDSEEEFSERAMVEFQVEKLDRNAQMKNILLDSRMEGSVAFHFETGKPSTHNDPCGVLNPEAVYELPLVTESPRNHQDMASGKVAAIMSNYERRYFKGESSFSMAGVITELISCSRPIPFAGGISNRSDSSATSTRSFAFPTLEREFISSPVRMGKAERRRLQKQKGWRQGLICCKF